MILTDVCPEACRHCYLSAGPDGKRVMDLKTAKKAVDVFLGQVPHIDNISIALSGGEPMTYPHIEKLVKYISKRKIPYLELDVNTSLGLLKQDFDDEIERMAKLTKMGVDEFTYPRNFHAFPGDFISYAIVECRKAGVTLKRFEKPTWSKEVEVIGRARSLPKKHWNKEKRMYCPARNMGVLYVHPEGTVPFCCWGAYPVGHISEDFEAIQEVRYSDPLFQIITGNKTRFDFNAVQKFLKGATELASEDELLPELPKNCGGCFRVHELIQENPEFKESLLERLVA